ncbi:UNVERIFIED_CONTAM: hypothetical protein Sradi_4116500 [Sesamum radiatum]|uniref:Uncharacterized protein n=1 Tax=Sesamum radiatum TaxID=300843 RepID=A0AAW2P3P8_SESRA
MGCGDRWGWRGRGIVDCLACDVLGRGTDEPAVVGSTCRLRDTRVGSSSGGGSVDASTDWERSIAGGGTTYPGS